MASNVASQTGGGKATGQMHLSPSFPAPSEPSSLLMDMFWPCDRTKAVVSWDGGSWGHPTMEQRISSWSCLGVRVTGSELQTGGIALKGQNQPGRCALRHLASKHSCCFGEGRGLGRGFLHCSLALMFGATEGCSPVAKAEGAAGDKHADLAF